MTAPYTAIPNAFLDWLMADCSGAEVKVLVYVARRTNGTKKGRKNGSDRIALSQICAGIVKRDGTRLDRGTGLAKQAVIEALRRLERAGILERERGNGRIADTWRIAPTLPTAKAQAPEKRDQTHTATGMEITPQTEQPAVRFSYRQECENHSATGMEITPPEVRFSYPQKNSSSKESSSKESLESIGAPLTEQVSDARSHLRVEQHPLAEVAERLYNRHPKIGDRVLVLPALVAAKERGEDISTIEEVHAAWCQTSKWREQDGQFVPKLSQWISDNGFTRWPAGRDPHPTPPKPLKAARPYDPVLTAELARQEREREMR